MGFVLYIHTEDVLRPGGLFLVCITFGISPVVESRPAFYPIPVVGSRPAFYPGLKFLYILICAKRITCIWICYLNTRLLTIKPNCFVRMKCVKKYLYLHLQC